MPQAATIPGWSPALYFTVQRICRRHLSKARGASTRQGRMGVSYDPLTRTREPLTSLFEQNLDFLCSRLCYEARTWLDAGRCK